MRTSTDNSGLPIQGKKMKLNALFECAVSSVVEHYLDTVGVTGSNPVSRTISEYLKSLGDVVANAGNKRKKPERAGNKGFGGDFSRKPLLPFFQNPTTSKPQEIELFL